MLMHEEGHGASPMKVFKAYCRHCVLKSQHFQKKAGTKILKLVRSFVHSFIFLLVAFACSPAPAVNLKAKQLALLPPRCRRPGLAALATIPKTATSVFSIAAGPTPPINSGGIAVVASMYP